MDVIAATKPQVPNMNILSTHISERISSNLIPIYAKNAMILVSLLLLRYFIFIILYFHKIIKFYRYTFFHYNPRLVLSALGVDAELQYATSAAAIGGVHLAFVAAACAVAAAVAADAEATAAATAMEAALAAGGLVPQTPAIPRVGIVTPKLSVLEQYPDLHTPSDTHVTPLSSRGVQLTPLQKVPGSHLVLAKMQVEPDGR